MSNSRILNVRPSWPGAMFYAGLLAICLAILADCGSRSSVEGVVTLDQQPLDQGYISFRPLPGVEGPVLGATVDKGRYALPDAKARLDGKFRVEITAVGRTGQRQLDDNGCPVEAEGQVLPAKYNKQSQLIAELKPGAPNKFDFSLISK